MTPRQSAFDQELAKVAETYRELLAWDQSRARAGAVRAQYQRLQDAAQGFIAAWSELSEQARARIGAVLRDRVSAEPYGFQQDGINAAAQIGAAAAQAARMTPTRWHKTADRLMTGSVREVCKRHHVRFTSTVGEYGPANKAIAAIQRVAKLAGTSVNADNAALWIKQELRETKSKKLA